MDRLEAMSVFVAVCDANGFAPAARRLGLSPSVVTRHVAALEERIGVRLLHRTTRALHLTEAGTRYLDRVRALLADLAEAEDNARSDRTAPRGRLVVTAPVMFGRMHVAPLVRGYLNRYDDVSAELRLSDSNAAIVEEGIDVAIRIGALDTSSLVARKLGETERVVVAAPDYLASRGVPSHPEEIAAHATILFQPLTLRPEWSFVDRSSGVGKPMSASLSPRFATNNGDAAIDYALGGGGLMRALLYQVLPLIDAGRFVTVLDDFAPEPSPIHAVLASTKLLPSRVRSFIELAAAESLWTFRRTQHSIEAMN